MKKIFVIIFLGLLLIITLLIILYLTKPVDSMNIVSFPVSTLQGDNKLSNQNEYDLLDKQNNKFHLKIYNDKNGLSVEPGDNIFEEITGLEITKNDEQLFSLKGIYGTGWSGTCGNVISKFKDTSKEYIDNQIQNSATHGFVTQEVLVDEYFIDFKFFGIDYRLTKGNIFSNTSNDPNVFNPSCSPFIIVKQLGFKITPIGQTNSFESVLYVAKVNANDDLDLAVIVELLREFEATILK